MSVAHQHWRCDGLSLADSRLSCICRCLSRRNHSSGWCSHQGSCGPRCSSCLQHFLLHSRCSVNLCSSGCCSINSPRNPTTARTNKRCPIALLCTRPFRLFICLHLLLLLLPLVLTSSICLLLLRICPCLPVFLLVYIHDSGVSFCWLRNAILLFCCLLGCICVLFLLAGLVQLHATVNLALLNSRRSHSIPNVRRLPLLVCRRRVTLGHGAIGPPVRLLLEAARRCCCCSCTPVGLLLLLVPLLQHLAPLLQARQLLGVAVGCSSAIAGCGGSCCSSAAAAVGLGAPGLALALACLGLPRTVALCRPRSTPQRQTSPLNA
jgi:hypothetical protein